MICSGCVFKQGKFLCKLYGYNVEWNIEMNTCHNYVLDDDKFNKIVDIYIYILKGQYNGRL